MAGYLPRFVAVPPNLTIAEVEKAVQICMRLGLLDNRAGYVIVPQEVFAKIEYRSEDEHG